MNRADSGAIERLRGAQRIRVKTAKGRLYFYYYDGVDEKTKRPRLVPLDRNPVKAWAQYKELDLERTKPPATVAWMLDQFERAFLDTTPGEQGTRRPKVLAERTRREYANQVPVLARAFGRMMIAELRQHHVAAFLEQHPAPVSANRQIALLSRVYTWAIRRGWATTNPCARVERNDEDSRDRYITDTEYLARKTAIGDLGACLMDLGYLTGLRLGDLCAIMLSEPAETPSRYAWLASDGIYVKPEKTRKRVRRTLSFAREGAIEPVVQRLLELHATRPVASVYLVTNTRGAPVTLSGFESMWRRAAKRDGISDFLWIDIRAKAATDADARGHNAQHLLGHTSAVTTDRYLRGRRVMPVQGPGSLPNSTNAEVVPIVRQRSKNEREG